MKNKCEVRPSGCGLTQVFPAPKRPLTEFIDRQLRLGFESTPAANRHICPFTLPANGNGSDLFSGGLIDQSTPAVGRKLA
jgi:hypothetical protein